MKNLVCIITIILVLFLIPIKSYAETNNNQLDVSTSPHKILFDLTNLKPGDTISRDLLVINNGEQDFHYIISNKFTGGSKKFYNQLLLEISDEKGIIFKGNLNDFSKLDSRSLKSRDQENILFHVEIPYELGNEYQGLTSDFQFKIFVEGTLGGVLPADGPKLPNTATDVFQTLLVGAIMLGVGIILFKLQHRKSDLTNI
ncbi:TasA family protein [Bacillus sp. P14.5]|uniref:TasA family protein n=1 Tax=Bacillus sp. P14.5 TaxID=1983400 RepID=UPI000DEAD5E0|nr:TasA family protein [Bacillus sp. P14.5]